MDSFDLLSTVEYGGCSAKLSATKLSEALAGLPATPHPDLLVNIDTHDDAGILRINDDLALIQTTDFFSPVCSDPYEFGQIAAANALSDVYAMGGKVLTALNIVGFPDNVPLEVLREILRGGIDKVIEAGGIMMGGHTIVDEVPKYGLAVTGTIHPDRIITNAAAKSGDLLIITKPLGSGIVMAGKRLNEIGQVSYQVVLDSMKQLNSRGSEIMQKYEVRCATDITGFGLGGHALKLAQASGVTLRILSADVPLFDGALDLALMGCLPGACFRNMEFTESFVDFSQGVSYEHKMLMMDAQTSGGLLMCCDERNSAFILDDLKSAGYIHAAIVGTVEGYQGKRLIFN